MPDASNISTDTPDAPGMPVTQVMDSDEMRRAWIRIAHEVLERNRGAENVGIIGILRKGGPLAQRLAENMSRIEGATVPCGLLDTSLFRDDFRTYQPIVGTTNIPFDIEGRRIVLVDDVLSTGRTVRAALAALVDLGRPSVIQLAVMVDRGHRELPIRPDYVGKNLPTSIGEFVRVQLSELDGSDSVEVLREAEGGAQ